ncbi:hypothetical protein ACHAPV_009542 [Trichoderma viride]
MENHRNAVNDEQIAVLADRSLQPNGPLFKSCPLCGIKKQDCKTRLEDHIVGHLRSLALKSLPPIDDAEEKSPDTEKSQETGHERSTVENDPDRYLAFDFETYFSDFDGLDDPIIKHLLLRNVPHNVVDAIENANEKVDEEVDEAADEAADESPLTDNNPIFHSDLGGEQESSRIGYETTAFEKFIDEIEDRWQLEREASTQKSFDSEAFFAFLDHHFERPSFVLPKGSLKLDSMKKHQTALNVLQWHKKKRLMMARWEQSDMGEIPRDNQDEAARLDGRVQMLNYQMQLMLLEQGNKKRPMMARQEQSDIGKIPGYNHELQDYQMQLKLLEQQNKKRPMMARQEQNNMGGIPEDNQAHSWT